VKKLTLTALALASAALLSGCYTPEDRAAGGAALGGLSGASIGALASGGRVGPTLAGGALGAATGAVVGATTAPPPPPPPPRCAAWDYDPYGRAYCRAYY
jgi:hypothetical protein